MNDINIETVKVLESASNATLASWWSDLNRYKWPESIPDPMTEKEREIGPNRGWQIMSWISDKISMKECLRDWNKDRMNNEEFDKWHEEL